MNESDEFFRASRKLDLELENEMLRERVRKLSEVKPKESLLRHPVVILVLGFAMTGIVGEYLNARFQNETRARIRIESAREGHLSALLSTLDLADTVISRRHDEVFADTTQRGFKKRLARQAWEQELRVANSTIAQLCINAGPAFATQFIELYRKIHRDSVFMSRVGWRDTSHVVGFDRAYEEFRLRGDSAIAESRFELNTFSAKYEPQRARICRGIRIR